jgi:2,4-dienoyl-CoA reductase-like NADH-dependent reductase (Old Yellow Enzyme family)
MSTLDDGALFRPFSIKTLELKNRIVMSPMTRAMAPAGIPGEAHNRIRRRSTTARRAPSSRPLLQCLRGET